MDLRKDTWEWDDTVLPPLENTLSNPGMEYVKKTHEIWIVGGDEYSGYAKRNVCINKVSFLMLCFHTVYLHLDLLLGF